MAKLSKQTTTRLGLVSAWGDEVITSHLARLWGKTIFRNEPEFAETQAGGRVRVVYPGAVAKRALESELTQKLDLCIERIDRLTSAVEKLVAELSEKKEMAAQDNHGNRRLPLKDATEEIRALFKEKKTPLYYSDIMDALRLDLATVVKACKQLEREGALEPA